MKHALTTASIFAIVFFTFLTSPSLAEEAGEGELSWDTQATDDYASIAGHASRSVTSNPESEDTGSGSSGDGVTTQYEDSSTWDEQPHQECSTEKDEWAAGCFSDTACLGFQAALVRPRNSCSTSLGVRYPRAE